MKFIDNVSIQTQRTNLYDECEFCTILEVNRYTIKLFHEARGVGITDNYEYITTMDVYIDGELFTNKVAENCSLIAPINDSNDIDTLMKWIYAHA